MGNDGGRRRRERIQKRGGLEVGVRWLWGDDGAWIGVGKVKG